MILVRGASRGCRRCMGRRIARTLGTGETVLEAAARAGMPVSRLRHRLHAGWTLERALTARRRPGLVTVGGVTRTVREWCRRVGITHQAFSLRVARGMTREQAATWPRHERKPAQTGG